MAIRLRSCLGILAVLALCLSYRFDFSRAAMIGLGSAFFLALGACLGRERWARLPRAATRLPVAAAALAVMVLCGRQFRDSHSRLAWPVAAGSLAAGLAACAGRRRFRSAEAELMAGAALLLSGSAIFASEIGFVQRPVFAIMVRWSTAAGFGLVAFLAAGGEALPRRWRWAAVAGLFLAGALVRHGAVLASPKPFIDVYDWLHGAPAHLVRGNNPYTAEYDICYRHPEANEYHLYCAEATTRPLAYPPLPILGALPFRVMGLDVRLANVWCDLLAAAVLLALGRGRDPAIGIMAAAAYLMLPGAGFIMGQAWYEPMLAALFGGGWLLLQRGQRAGLLLLALALTGKQWGAVLLPSALRGLRTQWRMLLAATMVVAAVLCLPFLIWEAGAFLQVVIVGHLGRSPHWWGNTVPATAYHVVHWQPPMKWFSGAAWALVAWIAWRTPATGAGAALWMGTAMLAHVLLGHGAFPNYLYLIEYLLLLGGAALASEPMTPSIPLPSSEPCAAPGSTPVAA